MKERIRNLANTKEPVKWVGIVVAVACVVLVLIVAVNLKKAEPPFGCTYNNEYQFTEDYQLIMTDAEGVIPNKYKRIDLTEENFDAYFIENAFPENKEETARSLRENNEKAWYLEYQTNDMEGITPHYLLLQKNGDVYMVAGWIRTKDVNDETAEDSMIYDVTQLTRTDAPAEESTGTPDWGIELSVTDVTSTGATIVCERTGGNPVLDLEAGEGYTLQKKGLFGWKDVKMVNMMFVNSVLYVIEDGETEYWTVDWEYVYGELSAGKYRVVKIFEDAEQRAKFYAEFTIP